MVRLVSLKPQDESTRMVSKAQEMGRRDESTRFAKEMTFAWFQRKQAALKRRRWVRPIDSPFKPRLRGDGSLTSLTKQMISFSNSE